METLSLWPLQCGPNLRAHVVILSMSKLEGHYKYQWFFLHSFFSYSSQSYESVAFEAKKNELIVQKKKEIFLSGLNLLPFLAAGFS